MEEKVEVSQLQTKAGNEGRSNLVNKLFYKDVPQQVNPRHVPDPQQEMQDEQMQALVNQKLEQLDKAIEKYN